MTATKNDIAALALNIRRLYSQLQTSPRATGAAGQQLVPLADPLTAALSDNLSMEQTYRLVEGRIVDTCARTYTYRVMLDNGHAPVLGVLGTGGPISVIGPRDLDTLAPTTRVLCAIREGANSCWILRVLPPVDLTARGIGHQVLFGATRNRVDLADELPTRLSGGRGTPSYLAGRPVDAIAGVDRGWIAETGMRIMLDDFLATLGLDESCGVTAFYHDRLLRLAAYGLQLWTAGSAREALLDQGEYSDIEGLTPYEWEHLGLFAPGNPFRELSAADWQLAENKPYYSRVEPRDDYQTSWHRIRNIRGYLGHGQRTVIQIPPKDPQGEYASLTGGSGLVGAVHPKVSDDAQSLTGARIIQSAKGISLIKRLGGANPVQLRRPEDPSGDNETNHKFAGRFGDGESLPLKDGPTTTDDTSASMQKATAAGDLLGYSVNYATSQPFLEHTNDWLVPEEEAMSYCDGQPVQYVGLQFAELKEKQFLAPPDPIELTVDHRQDATKYYPNESGIMQLDDGGILIFDGFGSQMLMTGGNIYLSCPGDIHMMPGRDLLLWAGRNLGVRAKKSAEVAVSDGSMRIKAEKHVQVLAGNSGTGSVLLESRAATPSYQYQAGDDTPAGGVHIKAAKSGFAAWAGDIYLRTGGDELSNGPITLDAGKGEGDVIFHANGVDMFARQQVRHLFGSSGQIQKVNQFTSTQNTFGAAVTTGGAFVANGSAVFNGSLAVVGGHIATEQAKSSNYMVGSLENQGLRQAVQVLNTVQTRANTELPQQGKGTYQTRLQSGYYRSSGAGSGETIEAAGFSFQTSQQLGTGSFILYESRWQQIARQTQQGMTVWKEPAVLYQQTETFPLPGQEVFKTTKFRTQDLSLVDYQAGRYISRGADLAEAYRNPRFARPVDQAFNSSYYVIE